MRLLTQHRLLVTPLARDLDALDQTIEGYVPGSSSVEIRGMAQAARPSATYERFGVDLVRGWIVYALPQYAAALTIGATIAHAGRSLVVKTPPRRMSDLGTLSHVAVGCEEDASE